MNFALRILATAVATALAVWLIPGISLTADTTANKALTLVAVAAILGVVNAVVKPFTQAISACLIVLTLGLFLLVINALMLMLTSWLSGQLGLGFEVDGFVSALLGSLVISLVASVVAGLLGAGKD